MLGDTNVTHTMKEAKSSLYSIEIIIYYVPLPHL